MFTRILIANRGEIAVRLIRACREMGIESVAVYSEADANALHTRMADDAVLIGPPPAAESYLRGEKIIEAALQTDCEAIHPGYGFLSEAPDFANAVTAAGLIFIGPPADAIRRMGVKTEARALMQSAGVPVVPGFQDDAASDADFRQEAERIGYPVMVKASGGGGGKGIRIVHQAAELAGALESARREADHAFGDPHVFLEKYIERGRHIEVQVLADTHGNIVHLFERECSIQRRHQKIIEETPSLLITPEVRARMGEAAVSAARAVSYVNAGTVEFIADQNANFYFLEMNTRLQVEHPITEMVAGVDLPQWQIRIAAGERLTFTQSDLSQRGHAIECRIYAEDPDNDFLPATGSVLKAIEPVGPGIRLDSGIVTGDQVTHFYDPLLAKLIVHAENREATISKMDRVLADYVILGVTTNLPFLQAVIQHPVFAAGQISTQFIDEQMADRRFAQTEVPDAALIAAALAEMNRVETAGLPVSESDGDAFSPWGRSDSFRLGGG